MRQLSPVITTLMVCLWLVAPAAADVNSLARLIDQQIDQELAKANVTPAPLIGDHAFLRRVSLDLAGRVPTTSEVAAFIESNDRDKRAQLVAQWIDSPDFAFHQRNELDTLLLRRLEHNDAWREYLLEATRENRSWDQIFREVMLPEDARPDDKRPVTFLKKRLRDIDAVTNDTSIIWFGVNVGCAKCHDHPLVDDWKQAHYYGMASFFKRTFETKKGMLGERFDGRLKYTTTDGDQLDADFMFLTGTKIAEPESKLAADKLKELQEAIKKSEKDDKADHPPKPDFRPRAQLVDAALADSESRFFAKNIVNRLWARLFGRGLVHPLDQMHSENPASHPELLKKLSDDFIAHRYDLKRLIHAMVLSNAYARSTHAAESPPDPALFAAARPRPLSPHQLSLSCRVATSNPGQLRGLVDPEPWAAKRLELEQQSEGFARQFEIPSDGFQVPITEALWFSNNPSVERDLLGSGGDKLVGYLKGFDSDTEVVIRACRAILSRPPDADEHAMLSDYLGARADRREQAIGQLIWALVSSPEFRFNH